MAGHDMLDLLLKRLPPRAAPLLRGLSAREASELTEIRFRLDRPAELVFGDAREERGDPFDAAEMDALLAALSGYALYACERQMAEGYIPLEGGHRAGVCGTWVAGEGQAARMSAVTSVCVRIARPVPGASAAIRGELTDGAGLPRRVLLFGAPGCGKTTVLRDAALYLSDALGWHVAVADERQELFPRMPEGETARRIDVLGGADKANAVRMLLRAMAPDVLVTDEIGRAEDVGALLDAARCGVGLLASAHAGSMEDVLRRPALRALFEARAFERYVHLGRRGAPLGVFNADGEALDVLRKGGTQWRDGTSP